MVAKKKKVARRKKLVVFFFERRSSGKTKWILQNAHVASVYLLQDKKRQINGFVFIVMNQTTQIGNVSNCMQAPLEHLIMFIALVFQKKK